jgi:stage II sporulation protein P
MFNVTVVNIKGLLKFLVFIILMCGIIFFIYSSVSSEKLSNEISSNVTEEKKSKYISFILNKTIPGIGQINGTDMILSETTYSETGSVVQFLLAYQLPAMKALSPLDTNNSDNPPVEIAQNTETTPEVSHADTNVTTEVIPNNVPNKYTDDYNGVEIKNGTNYNLTEDILNCDNLDFNKKDIMIFHTHTCESYTPTEQYSYEETGTFRSTDLNYSVVKVGDVLTEQLQSYGFNVVHDKTYHDYPAYSGSYGRSEATVKNLLNSHAGTDIIIDLHRDAIGDTSYAPSVKIGDEVVSQLMFVIGTDGGGLEHPNWKENLKFAIKVQEKANELYPGLFRPILLRNSRYNQQLGKAACIIEVGATGNTLEQSMGSMKYLSKILDEVLKSL